MSEPEITEDLDEPFTQRSTALLPSGTSPGVVGIAGRAYLLDNRNGDYERRSIEVVQQRNTSDNRDLLLLPQGIWRQSVQSWHQGAGQSNLDRDNSLPYRFNRSFGVNVWDWWELSLLSKTAALDYDPSIDPMFLQVLDGQLVICQTETLTWFTGLDDASPVELTVGEDIIIDTCTDGYDIITLDDTGDIYKCPDNTTANLYDSQAGATFIGYNKDYLIVGVGNVLKNITGSEATVYTHPQANFRWVDSCDGNSCIYVVGGVGDKTVVHRIGIKQDGTGLDPGIVACSLPDGEVGHSIGSYLGFVFIGTDKGIRMAAPDAAGDLTLGALIPTDAAVYCFEGQDRFVWYGNTSMDGSYAVGSGDAPDFPTDPAIGLGRMDLTSFTVSDLTPAYANDLVADGALVGVTRSVVTYQGKRVFSVDGEGVYYETDEKMDAGWLEQGVLSYSVEDAKTALYSQSKWEPLEGSILLDMDFDSNGYSRYANYNVQGSIRSQNTDMNGTVFSRTQPRFVLIRDEDEPTLGPTLTRWELRARPARGRASRWVLPILNSETIDLDSAPTNRDPAAEYDRLMSLVESGRMFVFQESGRAYQCTAVDFVWKPEKVTESGKAWQGIYNLIIEEVM